MVLRLEQNKSSLGLEGAHSISHQQTARTIKTGCIRMKMLRKARTKRAVFAVCCHVEVLRREELHGIAKTEVSQLQLAGAGQVDR